MERERSTAVDTATGHAEIQLVGGRLPEAIAMVKELFRSTDHAEMCVISVAERDRVRYRLDLMGSTRIDPEAFPVGLWDLDLQDIAPPEQIVFPFDDAELTRQFETMHHRSMEYWRSSKYLARLELKQPIPCGDRFRLLSLTVSEREG